MNMTTNQVYSQIEDVPPAPSVLTIGAFDGVHRGHQYLLRQAKQRADALGIRLLVITFEPLPIQLFRPESFPGRIVTGERRRELLLANGADIVVELPFDLEMSRVTAEEFMNRLMAIGPLRDIWVGEDFALGYKRGGTAGRLAELTAEHGTEVHAMPRIDHDAKQVSSTAIRQLIANGCADEAAELLGHRFQVRGEVVYGAQIGRTIGFPTANVAPPDTLVPLQDGIYATYAQIEGEDILHPAMTYIGTRPAVNTGARMIETHLFDYDGDLYGKMLTASFVRHLRQDADFPGIDALKAQLGVDEAMARDVLRTERVAGLNAP